MPLSQNVAEEQLEQIGFALTAVAEDEAAGVRLVVVPLVQIHEDIAAELVPSDVEPMGVRLAGVVERIEIGNQAGGRTRSN